MVSCAVIISDLLCIPTDSALPIGCLLRDNQHIARLDKAIRAEFVDADDVFHRDVKALEDGVARIARHDGVGDDLRL